MAQEIEVRVAEGKTVRLDARKSTIADFASAFIDEAVARVRVAAEANQVKDVEMVAESFLQTLHERITYFMARVEPGERDLLLEWLVTGIVGGYGQDFLHRYIGLLVAGQGEGGGSKEPGGED